MKSQVLFAVLYAALLPQSTNGHKEFPSCAQSCINDLEGSCSDFTVLGVQKCIVASSCDEPGRQMAYQSIAKLCKKDAAHITAAPDATPTAEHPELRRRQWGPPSGGGQWSSGSGPWPTNGPYSGWGPGNGPFGANNNWGPFGQSGSWTSGAWTSWWGNNDCPEPTWSGWTSGSWSTTAPWTSWTGCVATTTSSTFTTTRTVGTLTSSITSTAFGVKIAQSTQSQQSQPSEGPINLTPGLIKLLTLWTSVFILGWMW